MGALCYLLGTGMKNRFLELLKKPGKLLLYLFCIGAMVMMIVLTVSTGMGGTTRYNLVWLKGAYAAFLLLFVGISIQKGLSSGDVIFEMQDVNLLFVSPISPKAILVYGLTQMIKTAFFAGFFILFQGSTVGNLFGKGFDAILILFFCFMFLLVFLSILSLVIYNLTNSRPKRKLLVKIGAVLMCVPFVVTVLVQYLKSGVLIEALENALRSPVFRFTPVIGWNAEAAVLLIDGQIGNGVLFLGIIFLAGLLLIAYIFCGNIDYYEDVLVATETAFDRKRAIAEGQANPEALSKGKVRVVKTGVGGSGASAFVYKHLRETMRVNSLGIFSTQSIFMALGGGVLGYFMREEGGACFMILQMFMWIQIFLIGTGRGMKELVSHYIYLIPENSFSKILWSNAEHTVKVLLEGSLIFIATGIAGGDSLIMILCSIFVFTFFSTMLMGINYLSMRWLGADLSQGILVMVYFLIVILFLIPGLIAGVIVAIVAGGSLYVGMCVFALWEVIATLICMALSKGVLHHCDMQVFKSAG